MDPVTILATVAAVGAATSAVGSISQGMTAAAVGKYNQGVAQQQAVLDQSKADAQAAQAERETKAQVANQLASYSAGGLQASGSPLAVMADTVRQGEYRRRLLQFGGATQAQADISQGNLAAAEGQAAESASIFQAGGTLLTGVSNAGMNYYAPTKTPAGT